MEILKQVVGIDVSKSELVCRMGWLHSDQQTQFSAAKPFANDLKGFGELREWAEQKKRATQLPISFVMEATGVYYESLAFYLVKQGYEVAVVLANKVKHYARSLNQKSKTDQIDAKIIAQLGLERRLQAWQAPSEQMRSIRILVREYADLKEKMVKSKNQLKAKEAMYEAPRSSLDRLEAQILFYEQQLLQIRKEMEALSQEDADLAERIACVETIPGVSFITAISIVGETYGFSLVRNSKQLVSYAGLDIIMNQSGKSQKRTKISKKGNPHIRRTLYMPAVCAINHNPIMGQLYQKLKATKIYGKIGIIAVARKLLILIYTLYKNKTQFDPNYANA